MRSVLDANHPDPTDFFSYVHSYTPQNSPTHKYDDLKNTTQKYDDLMNTSFGKQAGETQSKKQV